MQKEKEHALGYLPNETPPLRRMLLLAVQHVLTMFPPTVLVALIAGFDVGAVLVGSGLATVVALLLSRTVSGRYIPLYYGASFSYIAAIALITQARFGEYAGAEAVRLAQVGIVASGLLNIGIGMAVRFLGKQSVDRILPPIITGSIALTIGLSLSGEAIAMAQENWIVSLTALVATLFFSIYFRGRGILGFIPIVLGVVVGCLVSIPFGLIDTSAIASANWIRTPLFTLPAFNSPRVWEAVVGIAVISLATAPESTAHLQQISLYVDRLADKLNQEAYRLGELVGLNLMLDGIGDIINGFIGGLGGTNYGENSSIMAITNNFSGPVLVCAGVIAIALGFLGKLSALVQIVPVAVTGGLSIYLFGVIGMQGIAIIQEGKVNLFDPKQLGLGAIVCTIGLGGYFDGDGNLPLFISDIFPDGVPSIAVAAVVGVVLNRMIYLLDKGRGVDAN